MLPSHHRECPGSISGWNMPVSGPLLEKMEMSLDKSLHSADFNVIYLVWVASSWCQYSGLNNLQVPFSLHRSVFKYVLVTTRTGGSLVAGSYLDVSNSSLQECAPPNVEAWVQFPDKTCQSQDLSFGFDHCINFPWNKDLGPKP